MRSLGRLAVLTEELMLQYSPIILKGLSCMQQAKACQPDRQGLPHVEAPSQADDSRAHQAPKLERGTNAAVGIEAEAAAEAEPIAGAMTEGTDASLAADAVRSVKALSSLVCIHKTKDNSLLKSSVYFFKSKKRIFLGTLLFKGFRRV